MRCACSIPPARSSPSSPSPTARIGSHADRRWPGRAPTIIPVAIDAPMAASVDLLLEAGQPMVRSSRMRSRPGGKGRCSLAQKSDAGRRGHRRVPRAAPARLGSPPLLRPDRHCAPSCAPATTSVDGSQPPTTRRCWTRTGRAKAVFTDVESPISLNSSPATPPRPRPRTSARSGGRVLRQAQLLGRRTAAQLLARLRDAPAGTTDEALTEALRDTVSPWSRS